MGKAEQLCPFFYDKGIFFVDKVPHIRNNENEKLSRADRK